jgi:hypothetical protein
MAAKVGLGVEVLIMGGAVAAGTIAVVASGMFDSGSGSGGLIPEEPAGVVAEETGGAGGIDYNCNLPGKGFHWLGWGQQEDAGLLPSSEERPTVLHSLAGWSLSSDGPSYYFSVPLARDGPDGGVDFAKAYEMLCRMHPDLGGTGLGTLTSDEKHTFSESGIEVGRSLPIWKRGCYCCPHAEGGNPPCLPSGSCCTFYSVEMPDCDPEPPWDCHEVAGRWEGRYGGEGNWDGLYTDGERLFWLPPMPRELIDLLSQPSDGDSPTAGESEPGNDSTTTTKPAETQRWQVTLAGHEIDLMDRYWRLTTRVRAAVRFDYTLQGEFTLRKEDDRWVFDSGTVTYAEVGLSEEYWPEGSWEIKLPLNCTNCDQVTSGRRLTGEVFGDEVRLAWGRFRPEVEVDARIAVSCTPMPDCSEWKNRTFESSDFFQRINGQLLPLTDGAVSAPSVIDPASGLQWLDYTITVLRLDGG